MTDRNGLLVGITALLLLAGCEEIRFAAMPASCEGVTCSGHGTCREVADVGPRCECEPGYRVVDWVTCVATGDADADGDTDTDSDADSDTDSDADPAIAICSERVLAIQEEGLGPLVINSIFPFQVGGYVHGGVKQGKAWVFQTDYWGNLDWERILGNDFGAEASAVIPTSDGFVMAGTIGSALGKDAWLVGLDEHGTQQWEQTHGGAASDWAASVWSSGSRGYIVAGATQSQGAGGSDALIFKTDLDGVLDWEKTFGGLHDDSAESIQQTEDGGYIVAGTTSSQGAGNSDIWVFKLNALGSLVWERTLGGAGWERASSIEEAGDGGYVVTGEDDQGHVLAFKLDGAGAPVWQRQLGDGNAAVGGNLLREDEGFLVPGTINGMAWLVRLDAQGELEWERRLGDYRWHEEPDNDGHWDEGGTVVMYDPWDNIILTGTSRGHEYRASVLKLGGCAGSACDEDRNNCDVPYATCVDGTCQPSCLSTGCPEDQVCQLASGRCSTEAHGCWSRTFDRGATNEWAQAVVPTADGGFLIGGSSENMDTRDSDIWVAKLTTAGDLSWEKTLGDSRSDSLGAVQQTSDNGFVLAGRTHVESTDKSAAWVVKLDPQGGIEWDQTYGETIGGNARSIDLAADGGYVVAGYFRPDIETEADMWVFRIDAEGSVVWDQRLGGEEADIGSTVRSTADGGFLVAGTTHSTDSGDRELWIIELDAGGGVQWDRTYGQTSQVTDPAVTLTSDGGCIATRIDRDILYLLKLDSTGNLEWESSQFLFDEMPMQPATVVQHADGEYTVAATVYEMKIKAGADPWEADLWLFGLDQDGLRTWDMIVGSDEPEWAFAFAQIVDDEYIAAGAARFGSEDDGDFWIAKLDNSGDCVGAR